MYSRQFLLHTYNCAEKHLLVTFLCVLLQGWSLLFHLSSPSLLPSLFSSIKSSARLPNEAVGNTVATPIFWNFDQTSIASNFQITAVETIGHLQSKQKHPDPRASVFKVCDKCECKSKEFQQKKLFIDNWCNLLFVFLSSNFNHN